MNTYSYRFKIFIAINKRIIYSTNITNCNDLIICPFTTLISNDIIINNSLTFIIYVKSVNKPKSGNVSYKIKLNIISNNTNLLRIIYSISITVLYIISSIKRISASDGNRTRKDYFSPRDFKSLVFTNFTTKA